MSDIEKIQNFISNHHVLTLSTIFENTPYSCSCFYAYDIDSTSFIVASNEDTQHIKNIKINPKIAGNIHLETKEVGKIQGLQFRGEMQKLQNKELKKLYFKTFPYALALNPPLWQIKVNFFKLTDNRLGFGKKIIVEF
jgi:uncharacterized protein YhbP (UPF0306 family)